MQIYFIFNEYIKYINEKSIINNGFRTYYWFVNIFREFNLKFMSFLLFMKNYLLYVKYS